MTTVDQFLKALAEVESSDNPEAWGDGGRAMGRWQVHPARLWQELHSCLYFPKLNDTWDQLVGRVLRDIFERTAATKTPVDVAMFWHVGHWVNAGDSTWDQKYADKFNAALQAAVQEMP